MIKGTTPTHTFEVDIDTDSIKEVKVTYSQQDKVIVEKRTEECDITQGKIQTKLTQEETFKFDHLVLVYAQLRILTINGDVLATDLIMLPVSKCLDEEVLI